MGGDRRRDHDGVQGGVGQQSGRTVVARAPGWRLANWASRLSIEVADPAQLDTRRLLDQHPQQVRPPVAEADDPDSNLSAVYCSALRCSGDCCVEQKPVEPFAQRADYP